MKIAICDDRKGDRDALRVLLEACAEIWSIYGNAELSFWILTWRV